MKLRQFVRVLVQCPVECMGDDFFAEGMVINLSMGGLTITCDQQPTPGMSVKMRVFLPDDEVPLTVQQAIVAWSKPGQFGVKALSMGESGKKRLNDFIVKHINKSSYRRPLSGQKSDS